MGQPLPPPRGQPLSADGWVGAISALRPKERKAAMQENLVSEGRVALWMPDPRTGTPGNWALVGKALIRSPKFKCPLCPAPGWPAKLTIGPGPAAPDMFLAFDRDLRLPSAPAPQADGMVQTLLTEDTTRRPPDPCDGGGGGAASHTPTLAWLSPRGAGASSFSLLWSWAMC